MYVKRYESVDEFVASNPDFRSEMHRLSSSFANKSSLLLDMSYEQIAKAIYAGDEKAVALSEQFAANLDDSRELPATGGFQTVSSPFGPRASTSAWLAGSPTPCRRKVRRTSDIAPVKIVVGNFVSYGVSAGVYMQRSAAIIAFLQIVQRYRPIDLYASIESQDKSGEPLIACVKLESRPLNLSQVGFVIGHPAFSRTWGFSWLLHSGKILRDTIPALFDRQREALDLADEDIYIASAVLGDQLLSNPIDWIKNQVERINL